MYEAKAGYFDANVEAPWAAAEYGREEIPKYGPKSLEGDDGDPLPPHGRSLISA